MSDLIDIFTSHKSERSFTEQPIDDAVLDRIISTAYRAPTSVNSQQVSVVVTRDASRRAQIAEIAGGQPWIAKAPVFITFVLDMHKSDLAISALDQQQIAHQSIESIVSGSTDIGIALGSVMAGGRVGNCTDWRYSSRSPGDDLAAGTAASDLPDCWCGHRSR